MRKISIIHASRSRPVQAAQTIKNWLSSAKYPYNVEYILALDRDDPALTDYFTIHQNIVKEVHNTHTAIESINKAASKAKGDLLVVLSDDFACPFHWDDGLLKATANLTDFVAKTQDGQQPWIITMPIMDRAYYDRFGYIYNPLYHHMFADTELTHVADLLGRKVSLPITFLHNHYSTGRVAMDKLNERNNGTWAQGEAVYLAGVTGNFGLLDADIKGTLNCDNAHIDWLMSKGIKIEML